jgi:hypothetical protein
MAAENKKPADAKAKAGGDKKRMVYLKGRLKELKTEMQAAKKEMEALREKSGKGKKSGGAEEGDD